MYEGRNYGVPFGSNATALFYNRDAFAEAGITQPPQTWEELRETAQQLTTGGRSGLCLSLVATEEGTFTFLPLLWQAGGDVPTIGGEPTVEALSFLNTLMNEDGSVSPAAISWGQGDVYNQFIGGQCAMMVNGPWQLPVIREENLDFKWDVAPWPQNEESASSLGGENFAVGNSADVDEAVMPRRSGGTVMNRFVTFTRTRG